MVVEAADLWNADDAVINDDAQVLVLLRYHIRLMIISETLELRVGDGRVSRSWCVCVVSHDYGGLGCDMDGMHAGQSRAGLVAYREMPEYFPNAR